MARGVWKRRTNQKPGDESAHERPVQGKEVGKSAVLS